MNDKELADKVVALGVGATVESHGSRYWPPCRVDDNEDEWTTAANFVRDWRVAGALMEKVRNKQWITNIETDGNVVVFTDLDEPRGFFAAFDTSLPRAIIEACVEALGDSKERSMIPRPKSIGQAWRIMIQRETRITSLEATIERLEALLSVAKCPDDNCGGQGWSAIQVGDNEWEQQQCQWCYAVAALSAKEDTT